MKIKLFTSLLLFTFQITLSQTDKLLNGKVFVANHPLKAVEVINKTSKISTRTNDLGEFTILVKPKDSLLFFAKEYEFKRFKITNENSDEHPFLVEMIPKTEELNEVIVFTLPSIKLSKDKAYEQNKLDEITLQKESRKLKTGVYDGSTEGPNFFKIAGMIVSLFPVEKEKVKKEAPKENFSTIAKHVCNENFYLKELKLKPDEMELFFQFCEADPRVSQLIETKNTLSIMDFLYSKNEAFKNLKN